jgi:DNA-binding HxlR family transcriptional regulator
MAIALTAMGVDGCWEATSAAFALASVTTSARVTLGRGPCQAQKMDLPGQGGLPTAAVMKGYGQFCPIAVACETFAERWTPLILRELLFGARRFSEIRRGLPLISRTLLAQRLRQLGDAGIVRSQPLARGRGLEYRPTRAAEEFRDVLERLGEWGQRWGTTQFDPDNLALVLLMWNVRNRIDVKRLPARRIVVRFDFRAFPPRCRRLQTSWLILERTGPDVCYTRIPASRSTAWSRRMPGPWPWCGRERSPSPRRWRQAGCASKAPATSFGRFPPGSF